MTIKNNVTTCMWTYTCHSQNKQIRGTLHHWPKNHQKKIFFFCTVTSKNLFISLSPKNLHDQKILQSLQLAGIKKIPAVKLQVQMRWLAVPWGTIRTLALPYFFLHKFFLFKPKNILTDFGSHAPFECKSLIFKILLIRMCRKRVIFHYFLSFFLTQLKHLCWKPFWSK